MVIDPELTDLPYYPTVRMFRRILDSDETIFKLEDEGDCQTWNFLPSKIRKIGSHRIVASSLATATDISSSICSVLKHVD